MALGLIPPCGWYQTGVCPMQLYIKTQPGQESQQTSPIN